MKKKFYLAGVLAIGSSLFLQGHAVAGICTPLGYGWGCVKSGDIFNGSVKNNKLANDAVTSSKILNGTITAADIATNAVGASEIGVDAVGNSELVEDIVLGDSANSGSLLVRHNVNDDILRAHAVTTSYGSVYIGQNYANGAYDVDLFVWDPTEPDYALYFNASSAILTLGSGSVANPGDDGDIFLEDGEGSNSIYLDGNTGSAYTYNIGGSGFVKAWARINAAGTVQSCWRCNTSATETRKLSTGNYEVDFAPLSTNITSRPRMATLDSHNGNALKGGISLENRSGDNSSVFVETYNTGGVSTDGAFTLIIY